MSIAQLKKVQIVVPRKSLQSLVDFFEDMEIFHIDDMHENIPKEFAGLEKNATLNTEQVDSDIVAARAVLDIFQRFNPRKKSMLEDLAIMRRNLRGKIRIGAMPMSSPVLPLINQLFSENYPSVQVDIQFVGSDKLINELHNFCIHAHFLSK